MTITINTPLRNCRQKACGDCASHSHTRLSGERRAANGFNRPQQVQVQRVGRCPEEDSGAQQETGRLEHIGAHEGSDAVAARVAPDEQQGNEDRQREGNAQRTRHKFVEHEAGQVHTRRRPREFAEDEEEAARAVGALAKALAEVSVDARQPQPIIERQEQEGHGSVAKDEAKAHLQIRHARRAYPSRDGDERYA